ncbi:MAG: hypothetical protein H0W43_06225 [Chthoniobacterales bacterium]|nr:hypothetical protein [Chthoniobacterales bacterium]
MLDPKRAGVTVPGLQGNPALSLPWGDVRRHVHAKWVRSPQFGILRQPAGLNCLVV